MKTFRCTRCRQSVFFENVRCLGCDAPLGFLPSTLSMQTFCLADDGSWRAVNQGPPEATATWRPCSNYHRHHVCNWMVPVEDANELCASCRYTTVIPDISQPGNLGLWHRLEQAKRRLLYSLVELRLPLPDWQRTPTGTLAFRFMQDVFHQQKVLTGHDHGLITVNLAEADDAQREFARTRLGESYRTSLGHFRHEIGHFYWDQLIGTDGALLADFRARFGDERQDYATALQRHYEQGPPPGWEQTYISSYAGSHPWEDWAETWAHYLHFVDSVETAKHWRVTLGRPERLPVRPAAQEPQSPLPPDEGPPASLPGLTAGVLQSSETDLRDVLIGQWVPLAMFLNSMGRSLGQGDLYPFMLSAPVVDKLCFVHRVVRAAANGGDPNGQAPPAA